MLRRCYRRLIGLLKLLSDLCCAAARRRALHPAAPRRRVQERDPMSSLSRTVGDVVRIQYFNAAGDRKTIRLGDISDETAELWQGYIDELNLAGGDRQAWSTRLKQWVSKIPASLRGKLSDAGLISQGKSNVALARLGPFLEDYLAVRHHKHKPNTRRHLRQVANCLIQYFGERRRLDTIGPSDADEFRLDLEKPKPKLSRKTGQVVGQKQLADNTIRRTCGRAKQFFKNAARRGLIVESPFGDMKEITVGENKSRQFFITREMADKVLAACIDDEWRLIFALARYGGLRCPSEILALRWSDIDFETQRFTVHSSKTEKYDGKEWRVVPLFPELLPHIDLLHERVQPGIETPGNSFVITRYRQANCNLRTELDRAIKRAGLSPWPRRFQNLRSTRVTELLDAGHPVHAVCAWLGHSPRVAMKHYMQVTDGHFAAALQKPAELQRRVHRSVNHPDQLHRPGASPPADLLPVAATPQKPRDSQRRKLSKRPRQESNLRPTV